MNITTLPKKRLALAVGLFAAACVLAWFTTQVSREYVQERSELAQVKADLTQLDTILSNRNTLAQQQSSLENALPNSYDRVASVVSRIEDSIASHGLSALITLDEVAIVEFDDISSVRITLQTGGSYSAHNAVLQDISALPHIIRLDTMQMNSENGAVAATITMRLFITTINP